MADSVERETKFRDAALVLADEATDGARSVQKYIRQKQYVKAGALAGRLQRTAREVKWLMQRLPKD